MLKTIYNNCAGIDVHKKIIVVTIAKTDSDNITDYQRFENLINKNFKSHKNIQNTPEEMISYLTNLGYNITLQNA